MARRTRYSHLGGVGMVSVAGHTGALCTLAIYLTKSGAGGRDLRRVGEEMGRMEEDGGGWVRGGPPCGVILKEVDLLLSGRLVEGPPLGYSNGAMLRAPRTCE